MWKPLFLASLLLCSHAFAAHTAALARDKPKAAAHAAKGDSPGTSLAASAQANEYNMLIEKGLVEFELAHWPEAQALFQRAHELKPSARTLRSLGLVSFEQRLYVAALSYLQQALTSQERALTAEMREHASSVVEDCKRFVIYRALRLEPRVAELRVDGAPPNFAEDGRLMLDPGEHAIQARAVGHEAYSSTVVAHGGYQGELEIILKATSLEPAPTRERAEPAPEQPRAEARDTVRADTTPAASSINVAKVIGLTVAGAGIVGVGFGAAFGLLAMSANSDSDSNCVNGCNALGNAQREAASDRATASTISFVVGGALLAAGLVTFFVAPSHEERPATAWQLQPELGPGSAKLTWSGTL